MKSFNFSNLKFTINTVNYINNRFYILNPPSNSILTLCTVNITKLYLSGVCVPNPARSLKDAQVLNSNCPLPIRPP